LTRALLALGARRIIAIERDERAIAALEEIAEHYPGRLEIVAGDALNIDPRDQLGPERARVVANLPYNIATALLVRWLTIEPWPPWYDSMLLMFQREVAERIVAAPDRKSYGRLSNGCKNSVRCGPISICTITQGDIFYCAPNATPGTTRVRRGSPATHH